MVVPVSHFMLKEITMKCSLAYDDKHFKETVDAFVAGELPGARLLFRLITPLVGKFEGVENMITSRIYIDDISSKGFEELVTNKNQHIKIMVTTHKDKV